ncbi:UNVERIFIED_CONTAM: hypothetical protein FKN15_017630 [Acipenser sinensis]
MHGEVARSSKDVCATARGDCTTMLHRRSFCLHRRGESLLSKINYYGTLHLQDGAHEGSAQLGLSQRPGVAGRPGVWEQQQQAQLTATTPAPSADCIFSHCGLTMQPPKSYSIRGQRSSQAAYKQARRFVINAFLV